MFRRILIANRGEVAVRILRTCQRMGIEAVAVASAADRDATWLSEADAVVVLGPAAAAQSYLDQDAIIEAAIGQRCSAIHPGWGFLAENDRFASRCAAAGLTFVGPSPHHLRIMGDKELARTTMAQLGLPVIPGSDAAIPDATAAARAAGAIGYPVLLKAVAGGGGRGMRKVRQPSELASAFAEASAEATSAFGDGRMYVERLIEGGRHIEVQIIADRFGNAVHLGERECSLQRRHQKVLEEGPSPGLPGAERARILPLVAEAVGRAGYRGAGTVEMLMDRDGTLWFMEMNTRLQVEHPISEVTTGVDLVEWQLRVAANEPLPRSQSDISVRGHAIECRINAEDPDRDFRPSPGRIDVLELPMGDGIRVDTHLSAGDRIPPWYDSMVAKVIVHAPCRRQAIAVMSRALAQMKIEGITTNLDMQRWILGWDAFVGGVYDTTSLESTFMQEA